MLWTRRNPGASNMSVPTNKMSMTIEIVTTIVENWKYGISWKSRRNNTA